MLAKRGGECLAKKMGRPTDDLKDARVTARVSSDVKQILDNYCEKHQISIAEGLRHAILKLLDENK